METYTEKEVRESTSDYFDNDKIATDTWIRKYALKNGDNEFVEKTPDDMHKRLASEFSRVEDKYRNGLDYDEIYNLLKDFKYIVPQGSPMYGIGNKFKHISLSNCVVIDSPEDNMSDIINKGQELANLCKRRAGVGIDLSTLRPQGAKVSNSAESSSGAWSFADFYSFIIKLVGQSGRRGAGMITMDCRHPDIKQFVKMKAEAEEAGKVTGANVSVRITDDFIEAVRNDEQWETCFPIDSDSPTHTKSFRARDLWDLIGECAAECGDPGIIMWDNVKNYLPADEYEDFETISTNPCSEIPLSSYDSCRLISINMKHFVENPFEDNAYFDHDKFKEVIRAGTRLSDDLVDLELEAIEDVMGVCDTKDEKELWNKLYEAAQGGRRTGLGTHGLADCLARLGMRYDSKEAIDWVESTYTFMRDMAYQGSVQLAKERGPFPAFDWEKEKDNDFIQKLPWYIRHVMKNKGRRNISLLTCAPTGSVSIISQTSSGIEPVYRNSYKRRVKLNQDEPEELADYEDDEGIKWKTYEVWHHNIEEYLDMTGDTEPDQDLFVTADEIDWKRRVEMQAAMQQGIDHSISSTINLPKGTDKEVIQNIYNMANNKEIKGITVFVEGSKDGVLVSDDVSSGDNDFKSKLDLYAKAGYIDASCYINEKSVVVDNVSLPDEYKQGKMEVFRREGNKYYTFFSYMPEDEERKFPIALWILTNSENPKRYVIINRAIEQIGDLLVEQGVAEDLVIRQKNKIEDDDHCVKLGKIISMCLRHNIDIVNIVERLEGIEGDYVASTLTAVRKFLKQHIDDGKASNIEEMPNCDKDFDCDIVYQEGCKTCLACGESKCN